MRINVKGKWYSKSRILFFNGIINTKNVDPKNIRVDEQPYKNILIYYFGYVTLVTAANSITTFRRIEKLKKMMKVSI